MLAGHLAAVVPIIAVKSFLGIGILLTDAVSFEKKLYWMPSQQKKAFEKFFYFSRFAKISFSIVS